MATIQEVSDLGQAVWLDYISRSLITGGELRRLVYQGLRGVTSNPTILEKAVAAGGDYDEQIGHLARQGKTPEEIYEAIVLQDIGSAADLLRPVHDHVGDGYVSLEVSPALAHDTKATIASARRLFSALRRPNVFIKVPATPEGFPAIEALISHGINVNVTLIFSLAQYEAAAEAYLSGLEKLVERAKDPSKVASVASFFVSRVDTAVDKALEELGVTDLQGKIAIANAKVAYARFREIFLGQRWDRLTALGTRLQRPLWASTGTKNPKYPDTMYVDELIGPNTVNTVPPATLEAFLDHGRALPTIEVGLKQAKEQLARLGQLGISLDDITEQLTTDGVTLFAKSYDALIAAIAEKSERLR